MKSWEPDQVFDKADFPAEKRKQRKTERPPSGSRSNPSQNPAGPTPTADTPAPRGQVIPGGGERRVQAWTPGRLGDVHPARKTRSESPASPQNIPAKGPAGKKSAGGGWVPDQDFARADFPRKNGQTRPANGSSGVAQERAPQMSAQEQTLPEKYLRELILTFPDNAVNQLRNWFWAKPGTPHNDPALAAVTGHARIFIILASVGREVTEFLFTMMSPNERAKIQIILKEKYEPPTAHVQVVRRAFSQAIRGES